MKSNQDLIGKTITSVVAVQRPGDDVREIWMLQFSDGSHVEFEAAGRDPVPEAAGGGRRVLGEHRPVAFSPPQSGLQLALIAA